jgi:hypothetical protein
MTSDLLPPWFESEFVPSVRCHLPSKQLLLLNHCSAYSSADDPKLKDGKRTATFLSKNMTALMKPLELSIIPACEAYYCSDILIGIVT